MEKNSNIYISLVESGKIKIVSVIFRIGLDNMYIHQRPKHVHNARDTVP